MTNSEKDWVAARTYSTVAACLQNPNRMSSQVLGFKIRLNFQF
jgi:hypothetical protein